MLAYISHKVNYTLRGGGKTTTICKSITYPLRKERQTHLPQGIFCV